MLKSISNSDPVPRPASAEHSNSGRRAAARAETHMAIHADDRVIRRLGPRWALIVNGGIVFEGGTRALCEREAIARGLTREQARAAAKVL